MKRYIRTGRNRQLLLVGIVIIVLSFSLIDFSVKSIFIYIEEGVERLLAWTNEIVSKPEHNVDLSELSVNELLEMGTVIHFDQLRNSNFKDYINKAEKENNQVRMLNIQYALGSDNAYEYGRETGDEALAEVLSTGRVINFSAVSYDKLKSSYYIVDPSTGINKDILNPKSLFKKDFSIEKVKEPQILIYHTHASETYKNSKKGYIGDTVVGMGERLAALLSDYGYTVIHDKTAYDRIGDKDNRNKAYSTARPSIEKTLQENPSIEVVIDLHRDSGKKRAIEISGIKMAQIMFFNGLCRNTDGNIDYLINNNLDSNLAFSLQTKMTGDEMYPGLFYRIYLKNYRYNMHLCDKYLLIELGTENNSVEEAYNSMQPLADVLNTVLSGNIKIN